MHPTVPGARALDRARKMPVYARERVGHLWIVDPVARTLEVYRLDDGRWVVAAAYGGSEAVRAEPFETVAVEMPRWWGEV